MNTEPTPSLDEFLAKFKKNDNEWWYLNSGDHLNLFEDAVQRMIAAETVLAGVITLTREVVKVSAPLWKSMLEPTEGGRALFLSAPHEHSDECEPGCATEYDRIALSTSDQNDWDS